MPADPPSGDGAGERLACGASLDDLLAEVVEGHPARDPAHRRHCPHCRAALAELREQWAPVAELAAEEVHAPDDLLSAVMARVRELARDPWYAVVPGPDGSTRIAARVIGVVARLAAESVPRVALALGRERSSTTGEDVSRADVAGPAGEAATDIGVVGTHVVVDVQIAVDHGTPIPVVAQQVRDRIRTDLQRHTGLTTAEVNVEVVDVLDPPSYAADTTHSGE